MAKNIPVVQKVLSGNDEVAEQNRQLLDEHGVYGLNIMASPGAGKTSLKEKTVQYLRNSLNIGMINGDIATAFDAELDLSEIDLLVVENVGNLICPAGWRLGTHKNVLVASIPEGDVSRS